MEHEIRPENSRGLKPVAEAGFAAPHGYAARCEWAKHAPKGQCKNLSVCRVTAGDDLTVDTCEHHMATAKRCGWKIEMRHSSDSTTASR